MIKKTINHFSGLDWLSLKRNVDDIRYVHDLRAISFVLAILHHTTDTQRLHAALLTIIWRLKNDVRKKKERGDFKYIVNTRNSKITIAF